MIKMRRRREEVFDAEVVLSPIFCRRTFVIGKDGRCVDPIRNYDVSDDRIDPEERDVLGEEWEFSDDGVAIEAICTKFGNLFNLIYSPEKMSLAQVMAVEDALCDYGLSLTVDRDDYEQLKISIKIREYMKNDDEDNPMLDRGRSRG